jgi:hypothetical protein
MLQSWLPDSMTYVSKGKDVSEQRTDLETGQCCTVSLHIMTLTMSSGKTIPEKQNPPPPAGTLGRVLASTVILPQMEIILPKREEAGLAPNKKHGKVTLP